MSLLLDSKRSSRCIEDIIKKSEETLSISLPLFRLSETLFGLLKEAAERGVHITIIFSTDELDPVEKSLIAKLPHIQISCYSELNSKCYFNEKDMIITSVDIHNFQDKTSGDMSISLNRIEDPVLFEDALHIFNLFYESSVKLISDKDQNVNKPVQGVSAYHGFCIRCAMPITFNISKPYCRQCMNQIKNETDSGKTGNYCHSCACKTATSQNSPQCDECSKN